jgi:hypothetical protein
MLKRLNEKGYTTCLESHQYSVTGFKYLKVKIHSFGAIILNFNL